MTNIDTDTLSERLTKYANSLENGPYVGLKTTRDIMREARARVIELEAEAKEQNEREAVQDKNILDLYKDQEELDAENERLRGALKALLDDAQTFYGPEDVPMIEAAKAALGEGGSDG